MANPLRKDPMAARGKLALSLRRGAFAALLAFGAALPAQADPLGGGLQIETGLDVILNPTNKIKGLERLFIGAELGRDFHVGQSFYSAALGDAGGAFFWGFEATKAFRLTPRTQVRAAGFVGGGGGAAQVNGDGLMTRAGVTLAYALSDRLALEAGAAHYTLSGSSLKGPALSFGLVWQPNAGRGAGDSAGSGLRLRSVAFGASHFRLDGSLNRAGGPQAAVSLVGAEAAFHLGRGREALLSGSGALAGAEGYMEVMAGLRQRIAMGPGTGFAEARLGFGGGGKVDTGAGPIVKAGVGYALPLSRGLDLEAGLSALAAPTGDMRGAEFGIRLVRVFDRGGIGDRWQGQAAQAPQRWAVTLGMSQQFSHNGFRKPGVAGTANVIMQESSLDLFLTDRVYLTGIAQTTMGGGVAGYAVGLVGMGWKMPVSDRIDLALEANLGAAGGGGVNTAGGMIGGLRAEMDVKINDSMALTLGLGKLRTLKGGGMAPTVVQLGLKLPFRAP